MYTQTSNPATLDVLIIGAGLSGIGTAYWLQKKCANKSYAIIEARNNIGGTWDKFRYPGVRSDSDMFTFGYRFKPWQNPQSLSAAKDILSYIHETATENNIYEHILFEHKALSLDWSDADRQWTIVCEHQGERKVFRSKFLYMCGGYYNYNEAHRPRFEGEDAFKGKIILPQFWPDDLEYANKRVVVIGSGATAVTLVPAMADKVEHITMLQRSPTYIMTLPNRNGLYLAMKKILPQKWAYRITRWQNIMLSMLMFGIAKLFPNFIRKVVMKEAKKELPEGFEVEKHFCPSYNPWDQRLCIIPDGDLYKSIKSGKASVVTDSIDRFTEGGILLSSGEELKADIIVMATGLKIQLMGGATVSINGVPQRTGDAMVYKGMLIGGTPNFAIAFGYTNNSWTLKTDLTANYVCKLLNYMDKKGYEVVMPNNIGEVSDEPFLNLNSGYIHRAKDILPKQGTKRPWKVYQNYAVDMLQTRFGAIEDGVLVFV